VLSRVPTGSRVLDVGGPAPDWFGALLGSGPVGLYTMGATGGAGTKPIRGEAQRLPFRDRSFDVIVRVSAPNGLDELARVLAPGGVLLASTTTARPADWGGHAAAAGLSVHEQGLFRETPAGWVKVEPGAGSAGSPGLLCIALRRP